MRYIYVFTVFAMGMLMMIETSVASEGLRTHGRDVSGKDTKTVVLLVNKSQAFAPELWSSRHDHPSECKKSKWDDAEWNKDYWTAEKTLKLMFKNNVLKRKYLKKGFPVLEVGPMFYKLSLLDQQRTLGLLEKTYSLFEQGYPAFQIHDGKSHKVIGYYTKSGLSLN